MALIDRLFGRNKSLAQLSRAELRREEILLTRRRDKLFSRIHSLAGDKHKIFQQGRQTTSPELRKALAMDFELKTQEQLMVARELNLRSKELMTVARLRMVQENREAGRRLGAGRLNLTAGDMAKVAAWLENDTVSQEVYGERLDTILEIGQDADRDAVGAAGLGEGGKDLMHLWEQLDRGEVDEQKAFEQADQVSRARVTGSPAAAAPEGGL